MYYIRHVLAIITILHFSLSCSPENPRLLIKIPTRSRPVKFFKMLERYYSLLSKKHPYFFLITCDIDDQTMNNKMCKEKLAKYPNLVVTFSDNHSKIEAYNRDIDSFIDQCDIILTASDDMEPMIHEYDHIIITTMQTKFPEYDGVLNFHDGFVGEELNTYPILGKNYYKKFGYIYYPGYISLVCDLEITMVSRMLKKEHIDDRVLFRHKHPAHGASAWDALYHQNDNANILDIDKKVFNARRPRCFDIPEADLFAATPKTLTLIVGTRSPNNHSKTYEERLLSQLSEFHARDDIEILYCSPHHEISREITRLLQQASGKYVCFIDTSNAINYHAVQLIYNAILTVPDIVAINITDKAQHKILQSIYTPTFTVNCFNPVKRYIAVQYISLDLQWGLSTRWASAMISSGLLTQETIIQEPLYLV